MEQKCFEAYLMVEFDCETKNPNSIGVFSEHENEITMIGNEYVRVSSMLWEICNDEKDNIWGFDTLSKIMKDQLDKCLYDSCTITYNGEKWTIAECKKFIGIRDMMARM